jgi:anti-anti-sigma factor
VARSSRLAKVSRVEEDIVTVTLYGEHDPSTKTELAEQLEQLVRADGRVIVDLSQAEFVHSTVLANLVEADALARQGGRRLTLQVGTAAIVAKVLEITRLGDYLPCAGAREEAIRIARSSG